MVPQVSFSPYAHRAQYNAYALYKMAGGGISYLSFQKDIISTLLFGDNLDDMVSPKNEHVVILTERHFIAENPRDQRGTHMNKRCRVCFKNGKRRDVKTHCSPLSAWPMYKLHVNISYQVISVLEGRTHMRISCVMLYKHSA